MKKHQPYFKPPCPRCGGVVRITGRNSKTLSDNYDRYGVCPCHPHKLRLKEGATEWIEVRRTPACPDCGASLGVYSKQMTNTLLRCDNGHKYSREDGSTELVKKEPGKRRSPPPKYATEEERHAAKIAQARARRAKLREQAGSVAAPPKPKAKPKYKPKNITISRPRERMSPFERDPRRATIKPGTALWHRADEIADARRAGEDLW